MKNLMGALILTTLSFSTIAETAVVPAWCANSFGEIASKEVEKNLSAEKAALVELAKADVLKRNKDLGQYYSVVRTRFKTVYDLPSSSYKQYSVEVEHCDSEDYGQANCYSYLYTAVERKLKLVAIYDTPHSGAEETVEFVCE
jgi:hypothetical protein